MDKYQDPEREIKRIWKVEAKKSERKPENICNKYKSWIDSESRTPVNSENTKEDNGAWTEDSERGSQTTRRSTNISDTNTSIRGDKKQITTTTITGNVRYIDLQIRYWEKT